MVARMTGGPTPQLSEAERRFDQARVKVGRVLAPLTLIVLLMVPLPGLSLEAHRLTAIAGMTVVLWISEALPLAVTAVLAPALAVLFEVAPAKQAFAPFAHPLIFMFIGAFMLARALSVHGFDRRAALWLLSRGFVGASPRRALTVVGVTAFGFSMWINNTATAAMMCPIAIGLCASIRAKCPDEPAVMARQSQFEQGMLITLAYAASLGGVCTPVGTAPNMIAIAELDRIGSVHFDFARWMVFAVPVAVVAFVGLMVFAHRRWPPAVEEVEDLGVSVERDLAALGPLSTAEARTVLVFGLTIVGWLTPSIFRIALGETAALTTWARASMPEGVVAVLCASLLFLIPADARKRENPSEASPAGRMLLNWPQAAQIDWGTVLLLGGGLALGGLTISTGLADAIGRGVGSWLGRDPSPFALVLVVTALVVYMTELVSNTATINMLLPVVVPLAVRSGADPIPIVLAATMAASFAFMLPVSTPPNAVVYGSGLVQLPTMVRVGARLNLMAIALLVAAGVWVLPHLTAW